MSDKYFFHDIKNHIHNLSFFLQTKIRNKVSTNESELHMLYNETQLLLDVINDEEETNSKTLGISHSISATFLDESINHFITINRLNLLFDSRFNIDQYFLELPKVVIIRVIENLLRNISLHSENNEITNIKYILLNDYLVVELNNKTNLCSKITNHIGSGIESAKKLLQSNSSYLCSSNTQNEWTTRVYLKRAYNLDQKLSLVA